MERAAKHQRTVELVNRLGLHARAASKFVQEASRFQAEIRVRHADQRQRPFLNAFAVQVGHAVLGDDVLNAGARGDDARAGAEARDDARNLAALRRGGQRNDRLAAGRLGRAPIEVHLPAHAGEKFRAE